MPMSGWRGYALAVLAVAVASFIVAILGPLHLANGSMVYLGAVLVVAVVAGRWPAIAAAVGAFGAFNFLFTEPRFSFAVTDPDVVIALIAFLVIAIVTSQLAGSLRERAVEAAEREREAHLLHDSATLLATRPLHAALEGVADRLATALEARGVAIDVDGVESRGAVAGDATALRDARAGSGSIEVLGRAVLDDEAPGRVGRWRRVMSPHPARAMPDRAGLLRVPFGTAGSAVGGRIDILLDPAAPDPGERFTRVVATIAGQVALAAEQERLRRAATEAEVLRRTDELRKPASRCRVARSAHAPGLDHRRIGQPPADRRGVERGGCPRVRRRHRAGGWAPRPHRRQSPRPRQDP